ncbi:hypothetical protein BJ875DRAFT_376891 [Amylocarpus encephaloides]|uniref:Uncharacterized protein n=1 Tax=Amylocarpus encephaloides TaxID=45428 RepID=A0A9P8C519_9HELO|nr:hypothetical protein BJ875DRAFT_376891 [Amylocarpus encephaloides]
MVPNGPGSNFFYNPAPRADDLSPRSSSSSPALSSSAPGSPPRSMSSSPAPPIIDTPQPRRIIRIAEGNFTIDEFQDSDYEGFDSGQDSVIRPHEYEDAESDRAPSVMGMPRNELDPSICSGLQSLHCEGGDILEEELEREAWLKRFKAERRRKRRSSGSVQKRTLSQSIGSDTDDEDIQPVTFEGATSARRLRRKVGDRGSLIFDDPPPRIDELEEPESCEELVEVRESDNEGQGLRELPYYVQDMDVDSEDETEDD